MLSEDAITFQALAKTSDLFGHVVEVTVLLGQCDGDLVVFILLVEVELDWAWVRVPLVDSPVAGLGLLLLEGTAVQVNVLACNDQVCLLEALSWLHIHKSNDWNSTTSPFTWWSGHIIHSHNETGKAMLNQSSSRVAHSGAQ